MSDTDGLPAQAVVDARTPAYDFSFTPSECRVQAVVGGVIVADSDRAMVLAETRIEPVYYFPRDDVRMDLLRPSEHRTHCAFKGNARYWSLQLAGRSVRNLAWSYEEPIPEAAAIAGYIAFYPDLIDEWYEDGVRLEAARSARDHHYANPLLGWLLREAPDLPGAAALTRGLANCLLSAGIPVWRLNVNIRTLHPQLMAVAYRWWQKSDEVEELLIPFEMLHSPRFVNSPLRPIYEGVGGIRRRLDVPEPRLDFPILEDLHAEGGTDYVAMPMVFSDGQINAVTLASARPGGFSTEDLGHVYEVLSLLGRLYEVHALRYRATTLLDTYLGRHAGERVLDGLIKRGDGEDIEAVIWFCDLRESTPLADSMTRTEFLGLLNGFFDCMAGAVLDHGGQVLRFIGDAALAIFPIDQGRGPDSTHAHAHQNALDAAIDARERIAAVNARRAGKGRMPLHWGIALHPGSVTYGNIGTQTRLEFTVIGDAANRAARIESMCKALGRDVLASAEFACHFPDRFESLGRHRLRGLHGEHELFGLRD